MDVTTSIFMALSLPEKSKLLDSGGNMVAKLKLKEIKGKAPAVMDTAKNTSLRINPLDAVISFLCRYFWMQRELNLTCIQSIVNRFMASSFVFFF